MSTSIQWTEQTWNPIAGCNMVSFGCTNCYAMTMAHRLAAMGQEKYVGLTKKANGRAVWTGKINFNVAALTIPMKRRKPTMWFVNSMSDLFHEDVPFEFVDRVFAVMALCLQHTFQILTKRPERMAEYLNDSRSMLGFKTDENVWKTAACMDGERFTKAYKPNLNDIGHWPLPNVWLGTSIENQSTAEDRIPHLLRCPAAVRFLGAEPLLDYIDLTEWIERIGWVIVGGESGPGARQCDVDDVQQIVDLCQLAKVPVFVKQLGAKPFKGRGEPDGWPEEGSQVNWETGEIHLKDRKGGTPSEWPEDLRVREFPEVRP